MKFKPTKTDIKNRYIQVAKTELPDTFYTDSAGTLAHLSTDLSDAVYEMSPETAERHKDWSVRVKLESSAKSISVRDIGVQHNNEWVEVRGMAARIAQPVPRAAIIVWVCKKCEGIVHRTPEEGKPFCLKCGASNFEESEELSQFVDSQIVIFSERFEEIDGSRQPRQIKCRLDGPLCQTLNPGDRCIVGGVLTLNKTKGGREYLIQANNHERYKDEVVEPPALEGDILDTLTKSFCPRVYGNYTVKQCIILLLAGGSGVQSGRTNINMLLVGDPGIAKSTLLKEAASIAPLGRYTSGRGATAAGLTAGVARDKDGTMYLEAGAVVLTDGGVVCIDEFDKTAKTDRAALHEVMEQQTVSLTKIGTIVTLKARVSILAVANPKKSFWDDTLTVAENINLPDSLLTRFDLIFNLRDTPDAETDKNVAAHILEGGSKCTLQPKEVTAYIESVRHMNPKISAEAADTLKQYYVSARQKAGHIAITARQLEAARRLAGARAKIYRRDIITADDARQAIFIIQNMIQSTYTDPETNQPDHLRATTGARRGGIYDIISGIEGDFTAADIDCSMTIPEIERHLDRLHNQGLILMGKPGVYRVL